METRAIPFRITISFCLCCICILRLDAQSRNDIVYRDSMKTNYLDSVTVIGTSAIRRNSTYQFSVKEVKSLISVIGETDVLRYIGTLPGISQGMEGGLGFFIRGSNSGNNRIELDNVPVYGSAHLFGLFSVIPSDIVENVNFRSGKLPAYSGNYLSSLTAITSITPDSSKYKGSFSVSPFLASLSLNGPIVKNKLSFQASGRTSLLYPELKLLESLTEMEIDVIPEVADLYAKLHYQPQQNHTIDLSTYYSNDYFKFNYSDDYQDNTVVENWRNTILRLSWDWKIAEFMQLNTIIYYNNFVSGQNMQYTSRNSTKTELRLQTSLREWSAQSILSYSKNNLVVKTGLQTKSQKIQPAAEKVAVGASGNTQYTFNPASISGIYSGFADLEYKYTMFTASAGYRGSYYFTENHSVWDNNIRLSLAAELTKDAGLELSFDRLSQFHHIIEGLPVGWSLDLIIPSDKQFAPEKAQQYYAGGFLNYNKYLFSAGVYYKNMYNLTSYKNATNIFGVQNTNWMDEVVGGEGKSYGLEVRAERKGDDWNAALSYTLSKTDRLFDEINDGKRFPFKFDRRHILNITGQILTLKRKNKEQSFNFSLAFSSGHNITIPIAMYQGVTPPYWNIKSGTYAPPKEEENAYYRQLMSETNGYSMPYYLRIDIGYNFHKTGKRFVRDLTVGIFNVLNRKNPYLVFYDEDRWKQLSIFPIIPSVKWVLNF